MSRTHSTKQTSCRHGDSCFTASCPYQHSSAWNACEHGIQCDDFDCSANHPPSRKKNCRYGSACHASRCSYLHPASNHHNRKSTMTTRSLSAEQREEFCERLKREKVLVAVGRTGTGKSTQLPQYISESFPNSLVVCTQPRPLAVLAAAHRTKASYKITNETGDARCDFVHGRRILFMTDTVLVQEFLRDADLSEIDVLIIDEVHERSFNTDIVMGIAKMVSSKRRDDFHIVIATAATDPSFLLNFFDRPHARALYLEDPSHTVTIEYLPAPADCPDHKFLELHLVPILFEFYPRYTHHTLVFLSSRREIEQAMEIFARDRPRGCIARSLNDTSLLETIDEICNTDDRLVLFCTDIAETALAINHVHLIIDGGFMRQLHFDPRHQWHVLETRRISRFSADARRDIARHSRTNCCVRLYHDSDLVQEHVEPAIYHSSLNLLLLQLQHAHIDPLNFPFLSAPTAHSITAAMESLTQLRCLDAMGQLSPCGQLSVELALDPHLTALLYDIYTDRKSDQRLLFLIGTILAMLSVSGSSLQHNPALTDDDYCSDLFHLCDLISTERVTEAIRRRRTFYLTRLTRSFDWESPIDLAARSKQERAKEGVLIGKYLQKLFPAHIGHLLVPHLPGEGVRLINSNLRATISNRSLFAQRLHKPTEQYFVAMSIARLPSGRYVVDRLHPILTEGLPSSPIKELLVHNHIGWSTHNEIRTILKQSRSEEWTRWLVQEYDRRLCRLTIWGLATDQSLLNSKLQAIWSNVQHETIECGSIKANFQDGLICSNVEIMEKTLRLNLQRVPCRTYDTLKAWLKSTLELHPNEIKENNFQEDKSDASQHDDDDDDYEAPPFYVILKSAKAFERAIDRLPAHYICPQDHLSVSTTGTHMSEKEAWGRHIVLTIAAGARFMTGKEIMDRLNPHAVDCRRISKGNIRTQPSIQLSNLSRDTTELVVHQLCQPIHPITVSLRQTHRDGTGSASAYIFFADKTERQQAVTILRSNVCLKPIQIIVRSRATHQLVSKQIYPIVEELPGADPVAQIFLITAINRESAVLMYRDILRKMDPSWNVDSSATVTVMHPHLYPDFDRLVQQIAARFETQVQQQVLEPKHPTGHGPIRCYFNHSPPQKAASAAAMLAQATSPIIIKLNNHRQRYLFDELFSTGHIQQWAKSLKLQVTRKEKQTTSIEIYGPQVQQGQLMRQIGEYSDTFDERFCLLELNSTLTQFFGRRGAADRQLQTLADTCSNWGCHVDYVPKLRSILIYAEPLTPAVLFDQSVNDVKRLLTEISNDGHLTQEKRQCVFCGKASYSTNTLRACVHAYCRCASNYLSQTYPLLCKNPQCQKNIDMHDIFDIFDERSDLIRICKKSIEIYLKKNASRYDHSFCPASACDGLLRRSRGYQTCLSCGKSVCPSCLLVDDDSHQGRTCAERIMFQNMGDHLTTLFKAAEKFARDNWPPTIPPIIRIDYNTSLANPCQSMERFNAGVKVLGQPIPCDLARGFFAFHGTAATAIKPICQGGFDPKRRAGQACGPGEYFGVTAPISHGYCKPTSPQSPFSMIIAFLLHCPQLSTRPGFCYVMNNPQNWSHAFNVPVIVVSYGNQTNCSSPLQ